MKKVIFMLVVITACTTGIIFTGCQTSDQKVDEAKTKVQDAKDDLKEVQQDANEEAVKAATAEEWTIFKSESDAKIKANETLIANMKDKMKASGKKMDAVYEKNIDLLEQRNKDMRNRIDAYDNNSKSNWASFKREFNHDMDELGIAFRDLTVNNKN